MERTRFHQTKLLLAKKKGTLKNSPPLPPPLQEQKQQGSSDAKRGYYEDAKRLLGTFATNAIVCFTDGACLNNPGPCGAGAVVCVPTTDHPHRSWETCETWHERHKALGPNGTNNIGELSAIGLALDLVEDLEQQQQCAMSKRKKRKVDLDTDSLVYVDDHEDSKSCPSPSSSSSSSLSSTHVKDDKDGEDDTTSEFHGIPIEILTDSKYAEGMLTRGWKAKVNQTLISEMKHKLATRARTNPVRIHWVKGHAGIPGNERADKLANQGVAESQVSADITNVDGIAEPVAVSSDLPRLASKRKRED